MATEDIKMNDFLITTDAKYIYVELPDGSQRKIDKSVFLEVTGTLSLTTLKLLKGTDNMNNVGTCLFWGYAEVGLPENSPFDRFSGISVGGVHAFQIAISTEGYMKTRGSFNNGGTWSVWR